MSVGGFNYGVVSAGPAAELSTIMDQLINVYEKMMDQYEQLTCAESDIQAKSGIVSAQAQQSAAEEQAKATQDQAIQQAFSGAVAVGQVTVDIGMTSGLREQDTSEQEQLDQLNKLSSQADEQAIKGPQDLTLGEENGNNPGRDGDVTSRIREMQNGKLTSTNVNHVAASGDEAPLDEQAIKATSQDEIDGIKGQLDKQINQKYQNLSRIQGKIQNINTRSQMVGQAINGAVGAGCQGAASVAQAAQGKEQAIQQTASTTSQMAGSQEGNSLQYMGKYYDMIASLIAQFRAGANAYPQG